jgi:transcriptional regulator with XRE-family HTH domain
MTSYFARLLKQQRLAKGLTLREFSRRTGYDVGNLSKMERGILPPPPQITVKKWAQVLALAEGSDEYEEFMAEAVLARQDVSTYFKKDLREALPVLLRSEKSRKLTPEEFQCLVQTLKRSLT